MFEKIYLKKNSVFIFSTFKHSFSIFLIFFFPFLKTRKTKKKKKMIAINKNNFFFVAFCAAALLVFSAMSATAATNFKVQIWGGSDCNESLANSTTRTVNVDECFLFYNWSNAASSPAAVETAVPASTPAAAPAAAVPATTTSTAAAPVPAMLRRAQALSEYNPLYGKITAFNLTANTYTLSVWQSTNQTCSGTSAYSNTDDNNTCHGIYEGQVTFRTFIQEFDNTTTTAAPSGAGNLIMSSSLIAMIIFIIAAVLAF